MSPGTLFLTVRHSIKSINLFDMARIKFSPVVTSIAGSVGGVTIQRNKYGNTMRQRPFPLNPASTAQYNVRQKMIFLQTSWKNLTDAQRLQWDRYLDFSGQTTKNDKNVKLSGHTLYLKYQMLRLLTDRPLLTEIGYSPMPAVASLGGITVTPSAITLVFSTALDIANWFYYCRLTSPRPPNRAFSRQGLRGMPTPYSDTVPQQCTYSYLKAFGLLPVDQDWIHYTLQYYSYTAPVYSGIISGVIEIEG